MAEHSSELRRVSWNEVFGFTHIFKSFRMAIHPSKIMLSLAAIIVLYVGGMILGGIWSMAGVRAEVNIATPLRQNYATEAYLHYALPQDQYDAILDQREDQKTQAIVDLWVSAINEHRNLTSYVGRVQNYPYFGDAFKDFEEAQSKEQKLDEGKDPDLEALTKKAEDDPSGALSDIEEIFAKEVDRIETLLDQAADDDKDGSAWKRLEQDDSLQGKEELKEDKTDELKENIQRARAALTGRKVAFARSLQTIRGVNVFRAFADYEWHNISQALRAVRYGNIFSGLEGYRQTVSRGDIPAAAAGIPEQAAANPAPQGDPPGFLVYSLRAAHGWCWLLKEYTVFAILYLALTLATVSLFGGAVHRICALHFAREEKISAVQALRFSASKFLSFLTAPLIPLGVIFLIGLILIIGGFLLGTWGGAIPMAILLPLALLLGMFAAFMAIGLVGGFPLMYPAIAAEGSDSFDALSRSFSYVFGRPWRSIFYGLVAVVYGVLTYLFVRLFVFLTLKLVHWFAGMGIGVGGDTLSPDASKLDVVWKAPTYDSLWGEFHWQAMGGTEPIGAWLIGVWVFLLAAGVGAFLLSYAASSSCSIYFLLRRKVDATDLDEVFVDEIEHDDYSMMSVESAKDDTAGPAGDKTTESAGEEGSQDKAEESSDENKPKEESEDESGEDNEEN